MSEKLLDRFRSTFEGSRYLHRNSTLGDQIACELFEDLYELDRCRKFRQHVQSGIGVMNIANARVGHKARRGDGTFGESVPGAPSVTLSGSSVPCGQLAALNIGCEVKILNKAMIKQIDRVIGDLRKQVEHFKSGGDNPITIAVVGINRSEIVCGYEGERTTVTNGMKHKHPIQEADEAERRILESVKPAFDELLVLRFKATNMEPYPFEWVDHSANSLAYATLLARVCREYERRF